MQVSSGGPKLDLTQKNKNLSGLNYTGVFMGKAHDGVRQLRTYTKSSLTISDVVSGSTAYMLYKKIELR